MTATVEFITDQRENALLIPNSALQFKPPENLLAAYLQERAAQRREDVSGASTSPVPTVSPTDATAPRQRRGGQGGNGTGQPAPRLSDEQRAALRQQRNGRAGAGGASPNDRARNFLNSLPADVKMLWALDGNGKLTGVTVRTGLSDGQKTEIISDRVKEGMEFLTGTSTGTAVQRNNTQQGRGARMFF
jgi:hypothetical protein